jgi:transposase-like protein
MKKKISISEPERLAKFMHTFDQNHSDDFKALVLHLIHQSDLETVSSQIGIAQSTLYDWQSDWNKKKSLG